MPKESTRGLEGSVPRTTLKLDNWIQNITNGSVDQGRLQICREKLMGEKDR